MEYLGNLIYHKHLGPESTKRCLKKVLLCWCLSFSDLSNVLVAVKNVINNCALTYIDIDSIEEILMPNHLIYSQRVSLYNLERLDQEGNDKFSSRHRFLYRSKVRRDFTKRWELVTSRNQD